MPGLNDPNDSSFTDPSQNGAWQWNAESKRWEPKDPLVNSLWGLPKAVGLQAQTIDADAPGSSLGTGQSFDDRSRMAGYLAQLQGQAQTGGGAWEQALKQNTEKVKGTAEALGQSTPGLDPMAASRSIGNAQAGADQRAVGQGELLRAQTKQQAQSQLADVLGGQGALDAQQAAGEAAAHQGVYQTNRALEQGAAKNRLQLVGSAGQAVMGGVGMSEGGEVPGTPKVPGDHPVNDTVPAQLVTDNGEPLPGGVHVSPGEIVIPNSITQSADPARGAAAFVQAVLARGATPGKHNFPDGGQVPSFTDDVDTEDATGRSANHAWLQSGDKKVISSRILSPAEQATLPDNVDHSKPSIGNGALLDTRAYNQTRDANLANSSNLLGQFNGYGPSTAPQAMQNAQDSTIADAMRAQAGARRPVDAAGAAAEQEQGAAGNAAGIVAGESQRGGAAFAEAINKQRAQDLALATAQQQAAWRNTMMNAGIGLEQQAQLRNLLGGAAQAAMSTTSMFDVDGGGGAQHDFSPNASSDHSMSDHGGMGGRDDGGSGQGDYEVGPAGYAADGGVIVSHFSRQGTRPKAKRPESSGVSEQRKAETGKRLRDRITPPVVDSSWQGVRERLGYGTQTEDVQQFAEGGPVFYGADNATPQPGPFAPQANKNANALALLASLLRPSGAPVPDESQPTPFQLAEQARSPRNPDGSAVAPPAPVAPPMPHNDTARERPFIAQPAAPEVPAPAPVAKPVAPRPAPKADPYAMAQRAGEEKAAVESQQATETTQALQDAQKALEQNAISQNEAHARATAAAKSQLAAIQKSREALKALDMTVDPGRFMASRGIPGKIAAVIGLVLGAVGNDNGTNRASMLLDKMIDRDLDAQKAEHELKLRKGQADVDAATNIYGMTRQMTQDDIAAAAAAKGTMLDLVKNQIDIAAAKAGAPMAKANLSALSAQLAQKKMEADAAVSQRSFDNHIKQQNADTERMQAEAQAVAAGAKSAGNSFVAPGYELAPGAKPKPEELEKWRAARAGADDVKAKAMQLRQMISSGDLSGTDRFRGAQRAKAEALIGSLKVAAKEAFTLGALSGPDMDLLMSQISDPTGLSGLFTKDKTMTSKLDQFISNADQTVTKKGDSLGVVKSSEKPRGGGQDDAGARAWLAANPNDPRAAAVRAKLEGR